MTTVVLGAGAVGHGDGLVSQEGRSRRGVVERQPEAAMETSWGNGGVIHASEVEPWSQPGMPMKIIKWLGKENAPLLLRYGAIPHMWRWGLEFARNCTPERFRANSKANLASGASFAEVAAGNRRRNRHQPMIAPPAACSRSIAPRNRSMRRRALHRLSGAARAALRARRRRPLRRARAGACTTRNRRSPAPSISPATRSAIATSSPKALAAACAARGVQMPLRRDGAATSRRAAAASRPSSPTRDASRPIPSWSPWAASRRRCSPSTASACRSIR